MAKYTGHTITSDSALGSAVIQRSLRFNRGDASYLQTTLGNGNVDKWTWSGWVKKTIDGQHQNLFSSGSDNVVTMINFDNNDYLKFQNWHSGQRGTKITNKKFRDNSAWMHIVAIWDSGNSTADDRIRLYVNGTRETSFSSSSNPDQNQDSVINGNTLGGSDYGEGKHFIGRYADLTDPSGTYKTEIHFIDGYAYDPSYFGFTDPVTNIWTPKRYEGTYGTNGFYLDFSDNSSTAALGIDRSPNGNDFTVNNIAVTDSMIDTPTNNFATWNAIDGEGKDNLGSFSEGNLKVQIAYQGNAEESGATLSFSSGKWYWEEYMQSSTGDASNVGVGVKSIEGIYANSGNHWRVRGGGGESDHNGSQTNVSGFSWTTGDIIGIAVDMDDGNWTVSKNGTFIGANIHTNVSGTVTPTMHNSNGSENHTFITNFGQDSTFANTKLSQGYKDAFGRGDFYYPVPSGYQALCSANLPPTAPSILKPQKHFDTILYSGTGSSNSITGLEFAPDFIWAKRRDTGGHHHLLVDTIRGGSKSVMSNLSDAENSNANRDMTFLDNGIRWNSNTGNANASGGTYVVWSWKGGGTAVSNTDGSITSSVSVNQEAGFSICSFTINTSGVYTIGHGLGKAPDWIMMKNRDTTNNWDCYHSYIGNTKRFKLNSRDAGQDYTEPWNDTTPTSSVFTSTGSWLGGDGNKIIAYCWTSIPGYSKMGGYRGSGSSDGPYIHLGFRPAWILIKADLSESWYLYDNKRDPFNVVNNELRVDHDYVAGTFTFCEFLSDGFRILATDTNSNGDGSSYFYIAFAEQPGTTPFDTFPNAR